jgi:hypothetical protein
MAPPARVPTATTALLVVAAALLVLAPSTAAAARTTYLLDVPGRLQYEQGNGYCGELTLQQLMLPFGVWIPQQYARDVAKGEMLPGINYSQAMDSLKIRYNSFSASGYRAFVSWAKKQLMAPIRAGVVTVAYIKGETDPSYDHIMPIVGIETSSPPSSFVYASTDTFFVNTDFSTKVVKRNVSDYSCNSRNRQPLANAGCVPSDTIWGYSVLGPKYSGIGPSVRLSVPRPDEPQPPGGAGETFAGALKVSGLTVGKKYKVYKVTSLAKVPGSASGSVLADGDLMATFTAAAGEWSSPVSFLSSVPAWFICVAAA